MAQLLRSPGALHSGAFDRASADDESETGSEQAEENAVESQANTDCEVYIPISF